MHCALWPLFSSNKRRLHLFFFLHRVKHVGSISISFFLFESVVMHFIAANFFNFFGFRGYQNISGVEKKS